ncbi:MAG: response regulator [Terriglobia bacterium]
MSETERASILLVDDEVRVLEALRRNLRTHFDITTATSGAEAIDILEHKGPFAVLVSDLRMPGMGGLELLAQARNLAPDTTRVLLTGKSDFASVIAGAAGHPGVVSEGLIFRFLTKPLLPDLFLKALEAAVGHHRSTTAQRVLLEQKLRPGPSPSLAGEENGG